MKDQAGYFLGDALLALFIFLLGAAAAHRLAQATHQAQRHHQWRLKAHSLLENAAHWQPSSGEPSWVRFFDVMGEPSGNDGFFKLEASVQFSESTHTVSYEITYRDGQASSLRFWRQFTYWRGS